LFDHLVHVLPVFLPCGSQGNLASCGKVANRRPCLQGEASLFPLLPIAAEIAKGGGFDMPRRRYAISLGREAYRAGSANARTVASGRCRR
jgi:hypothetical protein